jgi:hypothetical protein
VKRQLVALIALCIFLSLSSQGPAAQVATPRSFNKTLRLYGVTFVVSCANDQSLPMVRIAPSGLELDNRPIVRQADGLVVRAEVADLDVDRSPEIYVYVQSVGSGSYGSLIAYAANNRKSLSEINLLPLDRDQRAAKGYRGHDEFRVAERTLVRRFPVYLDGDTNAKPTGGMRQIHYKLAKGEAGWLLRVDRIID